jgi:uncharacterized membrane protein
MNTSHFTSAVCVIFFSFLLLFSCSKTDPFPEEVNQVNNLNGIKFSAHIKPLLDNKCGECHGPGQSQTNYVDFTNAKNGISNILNRIQREEGATGFMPRNGSKLTEKEIELIKQWKEDGFLK